MQAGILDHVLVRRDASPQEALQETFALAQRSESLGFKRFWVGEQHLERSGCGTPEILLPILLEKTRTIRIGSGGIMLPHVNPYRMAKAAQLLTRVYGDRLDLGFGRANGADGAELEGLNFGNRFVPFEDKFAELAHYFEGEGSPLRLFQAAPVPELFILSSTENLVAYAKRLGVSVAVPHFIQPSQAGAALRTFQATPAESARTTHAILAVQVLVTRDESSLHRRSLNYLRHIQNLKQDARSFLPDRNDRPTMDRESLEQLARGPVILGDKARVQARIRELCHQSRPDEIIFALYGPELEDKYETLEILAEIADGL